MSLSLYKQVLASISKKRKGRIIFPGDYLGMGSVNAIKQVILRLVKNGILIRLAHGVYLYPRHDKQLGILYPSMDDIAVAIAQKDRVRILPTGVYALNKLGLSTQIPTNVVYLTDGESRKIKVGTGIITFKKTTPKKIATKGRISGLAIQALLELGKDKVDEQVLAKIEMALKHENKETAKADARLAPGWVAEILFNMLNKIDNDRMATTTR